MNAEKLNKPIKVLVISDYRSTHTVRPEAEIFIGLAKLDFDITIMTYGEAPYVTKFREAGIKVIDFHPEKKFDKKEIQTIREELLKGDYDILQLYNSKAIINGIQAAKGLRVKVVLYRGYTGNVHWYDPTAYFKYLHPRVDKIVCNSIGVETHLQKQLFFEKKKTVLIHKGHLPEWYENIKPLNLAEFNIPENSFIVTCVANARRSKGIPYLLKAFDRLPANLPVHLLLIGNDMATKKVLKLIDGNANKVKIHLTGFRKDALNIVAASNVFVLPALWAESITKSVIEAMALGVTPIITNIPGNQELIIDNESGLVVEPYNQQEIANSILSLYNDRILCVELGKNAQKRITQHFNNQDTVLKYKQLYEDLIKE